MENQNAPTEQQIAEWVRRDLQNAVTFLNFLRNDPELIAHVVDIVVERAKLEEEKKKAQPELDLKLNGHANG